MPDLTFRPTSCGVQRRGQSNQSVDINKIVSDLSSTHYTPPSFEKEDDMATDQEGGRELDEIRQTG